MLLHVGLFTVWPPISPQAPRGCESGLVQVPSAGVSVPGSSPLFQSDLLEPDSGVEMPLNAS